MFNDLICLFILSFKSNIILTTALPSVGLSRELIAAISILRICHVAIARRLAELGFSVQVIEQHNRLPEACALSIVESLDGFQQISCSSSIIVRLEVELLLANLLEVLSHSLRFLLRLQHLLMFFPRSRDMILAISGLLQEAATLEEGLHLAIKVILMAL